MGPIPDSTGLTLPYVELRPPDGTIRYVGPHERSIIQALRHQPVFFCPRCQEAVGWTPSYTRRSGSHVRAYFFHLNDASRCPGPSAESALHLSLKQAVMDDPSAFLPRSRCACHPLNLATAITADREARDWMPDVRPDVRVQGWATFPVAFEVIVTHAPRDATNHWYDRHGIPRVELRADGGLDPTHWFTLPQDDPDMVLRRWVCPDRWARRAVRYRHRLSRLATTATQRLQSTIATNDALLTSQPPTKTQWPAFYRQLATTTTMARPKRPWPDRPLSQAFRSIAPELLTAYDRAWQDYHMDATQALRTLTNRGLAWLPVLVDRVAAAHSRLLPSPQLSVPVKTLRHLDEQWAGLEKLMAALVDAGVDRSTLKPWASPVRAQRSQLAALIRRAQAIEQSEQGLRNLLDAQRSAVADAQRLLATLPPTPPAASFAATTQASLRAALARCHTHTRQWRTSLNSVPADRQSVWQSRWSALRADAVIRDLSQTERQWAMHWQGLAVTEALTNHQAAMESAQVALDAWNALPPQSTVPATLAVRSQILSARHRLDQWGLWVTTIPVGRDILTADTVRNAASENLLDASRRLGAALDRAIHAIRQRFAGDLPQWFERAMTQLQACTPTAASWCSWLETCARLEELLPITVVEAWRGAVLAQYASAAQSILDGPEFRRYRQAYHDAWAAQRQTVMEGHPVGQWVAACAPNCPDPKSADVTHGRRLAELVEQMLRPNTPRTLVEILHFQRIGSAVADLWPALMATLEANRRGWVRVQEPLHVEAGIRLLGELLRGIPDSSHFGTTDALFLQRLRDAAHFPPGSARDALSVLWARIWTST